MFNNMICKECICKPVCKHKTVFVLLKECSIAWNYLYMKQELKPTNGAFNFCKVHGWSSRRKDFQHRVGILYESLQPTTWEWKSGNPQSKTNKSEGHEGLYLMSGVREKK
ncbi:MAG: hypothetical protein ACTSW1_07640 [Candidatus Hodarchaeales archaeon]